MQSRLIRLIGVVFMNGTIFSLSDKSYSEHKRTQEISELMKLHVQGVLQNAHKFIRQLAHCHTYCSTKTSIANMHKNVKKSRQMLTGSIAIGPDGRNRCHAVTFSPSYICTYTFTSKYTVTTNFKLPKTVQYMLKV